MLIGWNFLGGAADSFIAAAGIALVVKLFPEKNATVVAAGEVMSGLGSTLGPFVGGSLYVVFAPLGANLQSFSVRCPGYFYRRHNVGCADDRWLRRRESK